MADDDDAAAVWSILGVHPTHFETLISDLMTSSNPERTRAEHLFSLCKQTDPTTLVTKLLSNLLEEHNQAPRRALSAILLRKQLTQDGLALWQSVTEWTRLRVKGGLLACVGKEMDNSIAKNMCYFISELAASVVGWPELLPFLFDCVRSQDSRLIERGLLIFAQLAQFVGDSNFWLQYDTSIADQLRDVFAEFLGSADVRIAAFGASISFIQCLESGDDRDRFLDLFPGMILCFKEALDGGNEAKAQEALELLIELAGTEPRFFRKQFVEVVKTMLQIAEADKSCLEEGTRYMALELVVTLAEARDRAPPAMRRDLPPFISSSFPLLDLGLSAFLGLFSLAQITERCSKAMINNLEQVVTMVLNPFHDPHPRVRWAVINAIGHLSTYLGPHLQDQFHACVLPALVSAMDDFQNPRVQAHAACAVLLFSENCTPDILPPYLDEIVRKLVVLLLNGKEMVQEGALTALASVADSAQVMEVLVSFQGAQMDMQHHYAVMDPGYRNLISHLKLRRILPDSLALGFVKLLKESTNVDVRASAVMWLGDLIDDRISKCTESKIIDTLISLARIEEDREVWLSVCYTLAHTYIVLERANANLEGANANLGNELYDFIEECVIGDNDSLKERAVLILVDILDQSPKGQDRHSTTMLLVMILDELIGKPVDDSTKSLVKSIFLIRFKIESDGEAMESLCDGFASAFRLFGGESGWPDLFPSMLEFLKMGRSELTYDDDVMRAKSAAIVLEKVLEEPLAQGTQKMIKHIFIVRIERETDEDVLKCLGLAIVKALKVFGGEEHWPELFHHILDLLQNRYPELRSRSLIVLEVLLKGQPLAEDTQKRVKDILLSLVRREKDHEAWKSLRRTVGKAFTAFGAESGWPDLFPSILRLLGYTSDAQFRARLAVLLEKVLEEPLAEETKFQVKQTLLRCVEGEDDYSVRVRLCGAIAKASNVFGGWPELSEFLDRCPLSDDVALQEVPDLIKFAEEIAASYSYIDRY